MERPTKVSLHSKRQQQRLLPRKHKAREEKETQCSGRLGGKAETRLVQPLLLLLASAQRARAGAAVLDPLQSSPTCCSYKTPPYLPTMSPLAHKLPPAVPCHKFCSYMPPTLKYRPLDLTIQLRSLHDNRQLHEALELNCRSASVVSTENSL